MADTGENRQISGRANAKQAEAIRTSKEMISEERSTAEASNVAFTNKGLRRRTKGSRQGGHDPDVAKREGS